MKLDPAPTLSQNALSGERSPYLLQHAKNPVHWLPWGPSAFEKARSLQQPIFLSIGYSTCHWCHVMAHESFENPETAAFLNQHFVCIKVDREERPDIDRIYMNFVQATTGSGGWPMSVWLTPDLVPFYGGTYFPPTDRLGRVGFPTVLKRIQQAWENERPAILQSSVQTLEALRANARLAATSSTPLDTAPLNTAFQSLLNSFDEEFAGFGKAPKFPRPVTLHFLLRYAKRCGPTHPDAQIAAGMALQTLRAMALGGMNDQLAGGFHRYSVDRFWQVPHYEKMLYDQALITAALLEGFQASSDPFLANSARRTLDYVLRDMTSPEGAFFSAEDADSRLSNNSLEHAEGAFYIWTQSEIEAALGDDAPLFCAVYGVLPDGNSPKGSDPHGELAGKNTLIRKLAPPEAARHANASESDTEKRLDQCRQTLLQIRKNRPRPHCDDKILTAWNGLMISAFAKAAAVLDEPIYLAAAQKAARFLQSKLWDGKTLLRSFRNEASNIHGFAEDYTFLIQALLDLYESDFQTEWLVFALTLQEQLDQRFFDSADGGYFASELGDPSVLVRSKDDYDSAEPAASSIAARNLLRLAELTGDDSFRQKAEKTFTAFSQPLRERPSAIPQLLAALDQSLSPTQQIVIAGDPQSADTRELLRIVHQTFLPNRVLFLAPVQPSKAIPPPLQKRFSEIEGMRPVNGKAAAYLCENFTCKAPVTDPKELKELLKTR